MYSKPKICYENYQFDHYRPPKKVTRNPNKTQAENTPLKRLKSVKARPNNPPTDSDYFEIVHPSQESPTFIMTKSATEEENPLKLLSEVTKGVQNISVDGIEGNYDPIKKHIEETALINKAASDFMDKKNYHWTEMLDTFTPLYKKPQQKQWQEFEDEKFQNATPAASVAPPFIIKLGDKTIKPSTSPASITSAAAHTLTASKLLKSPNNTALTAEQKVTKWKETSGMPQFLKNFTFQSAVPPPTTFLPDKNPIEIHTVIESSNPIYMNASKLVINEKELKIFSTYLAENEHGKKSGLFVIFNTGKAFFIYFRPTFVFNTIRELIAKENVPFNDVVTLRSISKNFGYIDYMATIRCFTTEEETMELVGSAEKLVEKALREIKKAE